MDSPLKDPVMQKVFPCYDVIICHWFKSIFQEYIHNIDDEERQTKRLTVLKTLAQCKSEIDEYDQCLKITDELLELYKT